MGERLFLDHNRLYLRLFSLRKAEAEQLLDAPSFDRDGERYPLVWALCQKASLEMLQDRRDDLSSRARFLLRRRRRRDWKVARSRSACAEDLLHSQHPLQTLACAVRLLEMHGAAAIQPLLETVRTPPTRGDWDDRAECAAWALGTFGREAVPEILQEYRNGTIRVRRHLCIALWYSGPQAGALAAQALAGDRSAPATAALLAMESVASQVMVAARRGPVWLDEQSVRALAEMAFSDGDRRYAAAALGCFGPAANRTFPILMHLAADPDPEVRLQLARVLEWGGRVDALPVLYLLSRDRVKIVAEAALESLREYSENLDEFLTHAVLSHCPLDRRSAARVIAGMPTPARLDDLLFKLLCDPDPQVLEGVLSSLSHRTILPRFFLPALAALLEWDGPLLPATARLASRYPDAPELLPYWRPLLEHEDPTIAQPAAIALGRLGFIPKPAQLRKLPTSVLATLLENSKPVADLLLPLLRRPEPEARLAAALALQSQLTNRVRRHFRRHVSDPSAAVALTCARALLALGESQHTWVLLRSNQPEERELATAWIAEHGPPQGSAS